MSGARPIMVYLAREGGGGGRGVGRLGKGQQQNKWLIDGWSLHTSQEEEVEERSIWIKTRQNSFEWLCMVPLF